MTDRSFPIVDAAPVCPFVAFDEDRDQRAENPDHRHRCYADERPAPRALAHQAAYCLSSSFPACPTFQDWARREAATPRPAAIADGHAGEAPRRNPPAEWMTPPAWRGAPAEDRPDAAGASRSSSADAWRGSSPPGRRDEGLAASPAYRLASGHSADTAWRADFDRVDDEDGDSIDDSASRRGPAGAGGYAGGVAAGAAAAGTLGAGASRAGAAGGAGAAGFGAPGGAAGVARAPGFAAGGAAPDGRRGDPDVSAPSWERPRRFEAYPTLKTRVGLPNVPRVVPIAAGVVVAAIILFLLPGFFFGKPAGVASSPSPAASALASAAAEVTPAPAPSALTYTVAKGDTMSKIAAKFHVSLADLVAANKAKFPDPNKIVVGSVLIIPGSVPSSLPGASTGQ
ncbi:MAG TPA: LysM peptidoglycan-binding domain-containing protein [Candidatus Limnocylindrales bacterium]